MATITNPFKEPPLFGPSIPNVSGRLVQTSGACLLTCVRAVAGLGLKGLRLIHRFRTVT